MTMLANIISEDFFFLPSTLLDKDRFSTSTPQEILDFVWDRESPDPFPNVIMLRLVDPKS